MQIYSQSFLSMRWNVAPFYKELERMAQAGCAQVPWAYCRTTRQAQGYSYEQTLALANSARLQIAWTGTDLLTLSYPEIIHSTIHSTSCGTIKCPYLPQGLQRLKTVLCDRASQCTARYSCTSEHKVHCQGQQPRMHTRLAPTHDLHHPGFCVWLLSALLQGLLGHGPAPGGCRRPADAGDVVAGAWRRGRCCGALRAGHAGVKRLLRLFPERLRHEVSVSEHWRLQQQDM